MKAISILLLCFVVVSVLVVTYYFTRPTVDSRIAMMEKWLREDQYVPSIGMYREAPTVAPMMIWLLNDYLLSMKVASYPQSTIPYDDTILTTYADSLDYDLPIWNIFDGTLEAPYYGKTNKTIERREGFRIETEVTTDAIMDDWYEYLDLCCYDIMAKINKGNITGARYVYNQYILPMWNGTGFEDKAVGLGDPFSIYKNAMFLYVSLLLDEHPSFLGDVEATIWAARNTTEGGVHTDYYSDGSIGGDMNAETTCWVLIWYYEKQGT